MEVGHLELDLVGRGRGDGEVDATGAGPYLRAELEELQPDGLHRGVGELGVLEPDAPQGFDERVGDGREGEAQRVAGEAFAGGAVGEELELLADAVLRLAAGAVELFVEGARSPV